MSRVSLVKKRTEVKFRNSYSQSNSKTIQSCSLYSPSDGPISMPITRSTCKNCRKSKLSLRHNSSLRNASLLRNTSLLRNAGLLRDDSLLCNSSLLRNASLLHNDSLLRNNSNVNQYVIDISVDTGGARESQTKKLLIVSCNHFRSSNSCSPSARKNLGRSSKVTVIEI